jgi:hypothetical protein
MAIVELVSLLGYDLFIHQYHKYTAPNDVLPNITQNMYIIGRTIQS